MQIRSFVLAGVALAATASSVRAQGAVAQQCAAPAYTPPTLPSQQQLRSDACQKALDLFNFMAPQLGTSITGGNATIGSASTLGGLGHFSVGVRANIVQGQLPQTDNVSLSVTGAQRSNFAPKSQVVGLPAAEAAVGLFKGVGVGLTNVGGVDALVSAFYVPDIDQDDISVTTSGGKLKLGYGVRVGVLQETSLVPGVSLSVLKRDLPTVNMRATIGTTDTVRVTGLTAHTTAWRLAASKKLLLLGLTAGIGQDKYDSKASSSAYVAPKQFATGIPPLGYNGPIADMSQKLTRTNLFAGASINLVVLRIAGEIGHVSGGSVVAPYNTFGSKKAEDPYNYASVGLRFGF